MGEMEKHPFSRLDRESQIPAVEELEERGRTWRNKSVSDDYLIGFVTLSWGTDVANQMPAVTEMQRRLMVEIKRFNQGSTRLAIIVIFVAIMQLVVAGLQL